MTAEEYNNLKRFPVKHQHNRKDFGKSLRLTGKELFECYTISNNIKYVHITSSFNGKLFDILECTNEGKPVRCPYKRGMTHKEEIADRLFEGDWRLYNI